MPLNEDTLKYLNLTAGDTRGNIGLLKDNGVLQWPQPLQGEAFKTPRAKNSSRQMKLAVQTIKGNPTPDESTINDLQANLKETQRHAGGQCVSSLSPDQYIEAKRHILRFAPASNV